MFRACISSGSRTLAKTTSSLHTSAVLNAAGKAKKTGLRTKKENLAHTEARLEEANANRPSIILGTRPGEEHKWAECDLAKVIVTEDALVASTGTVAQEFDIGVVQLPEQFAFGIDEAERKVLFDLLPTTTADMKVDGEVHQLRQDKELHKANMVAKALDLRNANAAGIAFENRRRIIEEFSTPQNPFDPGRTEVQVALLTYKIRNLWTHLTTFKRDVGNRRALRKLVHQRASLLKYLKGVSLDRYDTILERLALEPESVEGELTV